MERQVKHYVRVRNIFATIAVIGVAMIGVGLGTGISGLVIGGFPVILAGAFPGLASHSELKIERGKLNKFLSEIK